MNVKTTFIHGDLEEDIYISQPQRCGKIEGNRQPNELKTYRLGSSARAVEGRFSSKRRCSSACSSGITQTQVDVGTRAGHANSARILDKSRHIFS
ncbi:hypothetical protein L3X38_038626 [Prunus dulcis]|uniref:Transposable element protein n=1 Tax=Prunus dulcis TaxID=3755 RepID=A0AAD4V5X5_PRUDU|nr:hypothetical protein L3X38_038626 [Prunus dulcis]